MTAGERNRCRDGELFGKSREPVFVFLLTIA
jgi:hypothetical protein